MGVRDIVDLSGSMYAGRSQGESLRSHNKSQFLVKTAGIGMVNHFVTITLSYAKLDIY